MVMPQKNTTRMYFSLVKGRAARFYLLTNENEITVVKRKLKSK